MIRWIPYDPKGKLPPERRIVLVQLSSISSLPSGAVCAGYLRYSGGDKNCPFFVTPGVKRTNDYHEPDVPCEEIVVTHWADIFGDDFEFPGWPGTHKGAVTRKELVGRE